MGIKIYNTESLSIERKQELIRNAYLLSHEIKKQVLVGYFRKPNPDELKTLNDILKIYHNGIPLNVTLYRTLEESPTDIGEVYFDAGRYYVSMKLSISRFKNLIKKFDLREKNI